MMKKVDFLIVGGSAAGTTAADTIRALQPDASITIISDEPYEFYSRVLVPHYVRGKVQRDQVFLKKPEWYEEKRIELLKGIKAVKLESDLKVVGLSDGSGIQYEKLLIAVGGYVIPFNVPGAEGANILYLRTIDDADKIVKAVSGSRKAVIIGGGFIGLEFASCFKKLGIEDITILVIEDYFWQGKIDSESAGVIADVLVKNGVKINTKTAVDHFEGSTIVTKDGRRLEADVIGVGIGIKPDLKWLEGSGIKINRGILTNEFLETNIDDIYAAGDCAEFRDLIFERQHIVGNWANATSQGTAVGKTITGQKTAFETASSYTTNFFDPPRPVSGEAGAPGGGSVSFIGVVEENYADQVIVRGSKELGRVTRIFIKKFGQLTRIVGATVVNSVADVAPLTMAVKNKTDISANVVQLQEASFDLKALLSE